MAYFGAWAFMTFSAGVVRVGDDGSLSYIAALIRLEQTRTDFRASRMFFLSGIRQQILPKFLLGPLYPIFVYASRQGNGHCF